MPKGLALGSPRPTGAPSPRLRAPSARRKREDAATTTTAPPKAPPLTPASFAQDALTVVETDLDTALRALSEVEHDLLVEVPEMILTLRRAIRFCSVVPVLIPGVWLVLLPRMALMWSRVGHLAEAPRVQAVHRELDRLSAPEQEAAADKHASVRGALARNEMWWAIRLVTFAPPGFIAAIALALSYALF